MSAPTASRQSAQPPRTVTTTLGRQLRTTAHAQLRQAPLGRQLEKLLSLGNVLVGTVPRRRARHKRSDVTGLGVGSRLGTWQKDSITAVYPPRGIRDWSWPIPVM